MPFSRCPGALLTRYRAASRRRMRRRRLRRLPQCRLLGRTLALAPHGLQVALDEDIPWINVSNLKQVQAEDSKYAYFPDDKTRVGCTTTDLRCSQC